MHWKLEKIRDIYVLKNQKISIGACVLNSQQVMFSYEKNISLINIKELNKEMDKLECYMNKHCENYIKDEIKEKISEMKKKISREAATFPTTFFLYHKNTHKKTFYPLYKMALIIQFIKKNSYKLARMLLQSIKNVCTSKKSHQNSKPSYTNL